MSINERNKRMFKSDISKKQEAGKCNTSSKKDYHFYNMLFGLIVVLLLVFGIFNLIKDSSNIVFTSEKILDYVGLFFTVTGAVTALYFVIMGIYVYRTQKELDESVDKMKMATRMIERSSQETKLRQSFYYKVLYDFFSERIASDKQNADKYKLSQARLACLLKAIDKKERVEKIELLGNVRRINLNKKEIENDIQLLQSIIDDDSEHDEEILEAAETALKILEEKL